MKAVSINELFNGRPEDWAIGQFNVHNIELTQAAISAAEAENAPVILAAGPSTWKYHNNKVAPLIASVHKLIEKASVPVALHLDHARDLAMVEEAIALGFSSVMFDGSSLSYEENIRLTKEVVSMAHPKGISVEGEIGIVPHEGATAEQIAEGSTDPNKAAEFVKATGIDLVAVSVGSVHGMQSQDSAIDTDLIKELSKTLNCPQVLHGASGVKDEFLPKAIASGIRKININTMLQVRFRDAVVKAVAETPNINMLDAWSCGREATIECIRERIRVFNGSNKV